MAKQTPAQKRTVERVMHEFKHGELDQRNGEPVKSPKQAIAIALHEAGASNQEDAQTNRKNLAHTQRNERAGRTGQARSEGAGSDRSKADLYAEARERNIGGRSKMSKPELERALRA